MKVYRDRIGYATDICATDTNETEILDVIKSISASVGIRRDYALVMGEFLVDQFSLKKAGKNIAKYEFLRLFRIPSAIEVYICPMQGDAFSVSYNSRGSSYWRMFGVYFTSAPFGFDEYTVMGEV